VLCEKCHEREATIHVTQVIADKVTSHDYCESCGEPVLAQFQDENARPRPLESAGIWSEALDQFLAPGNPYAKAAYLFVFEGLDRAVARRKQGRHVTGRELLEALHDLAQKKFGHKAKAMLNSWGVFTCEDFGEIVFALVDWKILAKLPTDCMEDFRGGYDFETAFPE
jgi:uncharacterized repeat protein (TIGR04138 family)